MPQKPAARSLARRALPAAAPCRRPLGPTRRRGRAAERAGSLGRGGSGSGVGELSRALAGLAGVSGAAQSHRPEQPAPWLHTPFYPVLNGQVKPPELCRSFPCPILKKERGSRPPGGAITSSSRPWVPTQSSPHQGSTAGAPRRPPPASTLPSTAPAREGGTVKHGRSSGTQSGAHWLQAERPGFHPNIFFRQAPAHAPGNTEAASTEKSLLPAAPMG